MTTVSSVILYYAMIASLEVRVEGTPSMYCHNKGRHKQVMCALSQGKNVNVKLPYTLQHHSLQ